MTRSPVQHLAVWALARKRPRPTGIPLTIFPHVLGKVEIGFLITHSLHACRPPLFSLTLRNGTPEEIKPQTFRETHSWLNFTTRIQRAGERGKEAEIPPSVLLPFLSQRATHQRENPRHVPQTRRAWRETTFSGGKNGKSTHYKNTEN